MSSHRPLPSGQLLSWIFSYGVAKACWVRFSYGIVFSRIFLELSFATWRHIAAGNKLRGGPRHAVPQNEAWQKRCPWHGGLRGAERHHYMGVKGSIGLPELGAWAVSANRTSRKRQGRMASTTPLFGLGKEMTSAALMRRLVAKRS